MINVEIVTSADARTFLIAFQNHVYAYGLPSKLFSDSGSNFQAAFPYLRHILSGAEVKDYLLERNCEVCSFSMNARGSLNRGIGGFIESGVALIKKFIRGAIHNNVLEFQLFTHIVKQCICYANKRPLFDKSSLRDPTADSLLEIFTPEILKFGYDTAVVEVLETADEFEVDRFASLNMNQLVQVLRVKENVRDRYFTDFLRITDQATRLSKKYYPVTHTGLEIGDVVIIMEPLVKAPNYILGIILSVITNSLGETTEVTLRKGNR
jgi:hypothetical protein